METPVLLDQDKLDVLADDGFHRLAEFFDMNKEEKYARKDTLKYLLDWARKDPEVKSTVDLLWKIRDAENQYQTHNTRTNRAATLRNLLFLSSKEEELQKEKTLILESAKEPDGQV